MNRGVGVLIGIAAGWIATVLFNFGSARLSRERLARFNGELIDAVPWLLLILAGAVVVGALGLFARQLPGALFGAGLFMTAVGLLLAVAPVRTSFDISQTIIDILDKRSYGAVSLNGTLLFVGVALLAAGTGAFRSQQPRPPQVQPQQQYYSPSQPPGQYPG